MRSINCLPIGERIIIHRTSVVVKSANGIKRPCSECLFLKIKEPCPRAAIIDKDGYHATRLCCCQEGRPDGENVFFSPIKKGKVQH